MASLPLQSAQNFSFALFHGFSGQHDLLCFTQCSKIADDALAGSAEAVNFSSDVENLETGIITAQERASCDFIAPRCEAATFSRRWDARAAAAAARTTHVRSVNLLSSKPRIGDPSSRTRGRSDVFRPEISFHV